MDERTAAANASQDAAGETARPEILCHALHEGDLRFPLSGRSFLVSTRDLGMIDVPSGRLLIGDIVPWNSDVVVSVPAGQLRVVVTYMIDSSPAARDDWGPVACMSLLVPGRTEARRAPLEEALLLRRSDRGPNLDGAGEVSDVFSVDGGMCCCVDELAFRKTDSDGGDPGYSAVPPVPKNRAMAGVAPVTTAPGAPRAAYCQSGDGDGLYWVLGGYDAGSHLAAVHVDFGLLHDFDPAERAERQAKDARRTRWKALSDLVWCAGVLGAVVAVGCGLLYLMMLAVQWWYFNS